MLSRLESICLIWDDNLLVNVYELHFMILLIFEGHVIGDLWENEVVFA